MTPVPERAKPERGCPDPVCLAGCGRARLHRGGPPL